MSKNAQNKHDSEVVDAEVPPQEHSKQPQDKVATTTEGPVSDSKGKQPKTAEDSPPKTAGGSSSKNNATKGKVPRGKDSKGKDSKEKDPKGKGPKEAEKNNDAQYEQEIEASGSGASLTYPMQCSALRISGHVVLNGRPCKITHMTTSKTGKHGHAKVSLTGVDIFTGRKIEDMSPSTHNMEVPNIKREEYTLLDVDDDFLILMLDGVTKEDVKVPEGELGEKMIEDFNTGKDLLVTVIESMDEEAAISYKEAPKSN